MSKELPNGKTPTPQEQPHEQAGHTSGPWAVGFGRNVSVRAYGSYARVAELPRWKRSRNAETIANSALISAAPDLLKELEHLVRLMQSDEQGGKLNIAGIATLNGARAAIAKARGQSPDAASTNASSVSPEGQAV